MKSLSKITLSVPTLALSLLCQPVHAEEPTLPAGTASIRGDLISGILGSSTGSRIVAVDGRLIYGEVESCKPVPLTIGLHSLIVEVDGSELPVRLDAKPNTAYVVKWSDDSSPVALIEDGNTKEIVSKISSDSDDVPDPYVVPSGDPKNLATMSTTQLKESNWISGEADYGSVYLSAVDGHFIAGRQSTRFVRSGDNAAQQLVPGLRALMISARFRLPTLNDSDSAGWINMPILLNVEPATTYHLSYGKLDGGPGRIRFDFWIEDETHSKTVYGKTSFYLNLDAGGQSYMAAIPQHKEVSFPIAHGQIKRTPEKPKPWCEHD